ncbi:hypothetical protein WN55_04815 [Dufourea novaeangliae]|uniref:Uncharacterized protein n=1 Tax=Dufourea novaeangliae TaxID=178035 RepID=A0A154NZ91_DUFNO|nr:hypothetical protein WN55_04815 [Dufourea novaeangliae]
MYTCYEQNIPFTFRKLLHKKVILSDRVIAKNVKQWVKEGYAYYVINNHYRQQ